MAPQKKEPEKGSRGTVRTTSDWLKGFTTPRDGWILPSALTANADLPRGVHVEVEIEVTEGKARARRVVVETDSPRGVGWTALARVPIRDVVATAVADTLRRSVPDDRGDALGIVLPGPDDADTVRQIVQEAVGYRPRAEGFERGEG